MAKSSGQIAKKYAKTLIGLFPPAELPKVEAALHQVSKIWNDNPELQKALKNPAFSISQRASALAEITSQVGFSDPKFAKFFEVLLLNGRIGSLTETASTFSEMLLDLKNQLSIKVTSAFEAQPGEVENFKAKLQRDFGALASVDWSINKELIGGIKVQLGDKLLDGSVKGALDRLRMQLMP